jgi:hypothetical protein
MICFTKNALEILTEQQKRRILEINSDDVDVTRDFSLPGDYVYVVIDYGSHVIHGGIDKNGEMST